MIKPINNGQLWNDFVLSLNDQTFLHSWEWGQVQQQNGELVQYLGFYNVSDDLIGAALLITVNAKRGKHYLVPHGPLLLDGQSTATIIRELVDYVRAHHRRQHVVALKIAPLLTDSSTNRKIFTSLGFRPAAIHVHAELTWILDINQTADLLLSGMRKTTRHAIRKAEQAGVACQIFTSTGGLDRFWPLYEQTKSRHQFTPFSKGFIASQIDEFSKQKRIFIIVASYQDQDVAAAICIHFGHTVYYYHGASLKMPAGIPAAQLLQWQAIKEAIRREAKTYNFWGIAPQDKPNHPFAGITTFKKGFGGLSKNYLHAQDLPLSIGYWPLNLIETWRKWRRGF